MNCATNHLIRHFLLLLLYSVTLKVAMLAMYDTVRSFDTDGIWSLLRQPRVEPYYFEVNLP